MTPRMNYYKAAPDTMKAMMAAEETIKDLSLPEALCELVKMRVSQINGCAFCLDLHAPAARQAGLSQQKLDVLAAWRESPVFDDRERAALAWAEALTRIEQTGAPDSDYRLLAASFDERERVELTFVITMINAWNRFAVGFRQPHTRREARDAAG
ncbi:carboxymuconolactone decarboxylase family protein [Rhodovulum sulfidophilum]|nr:carboxymuconolactone decarboxylase family protein [Rhodovulum sulfidophilum]MBL3598083.1 carboxymuconolactone decarboxylase family protein [Rhodovulum sulfidophilum]